MSDLVCAPGVHMVCLDEDVVVLDTVKDRYAALVGAAEHLTLKAQGGVDAAPAVRHDLLASGLVIQGQPDPARRHARPARRDLAVPAAGLSLSGLRAAAVLSTSALRFRRQSLASLIATPRGSVPGVPLASPECLVELVAAARWAWPWIPLDGACLQRAFQLRSLILHHGLAVDWVFGVRTWPFAAHCWLQWQDTVINDTLDRVSRYTPILVV